MCAANGDRGAIQRTARNDDVRRLPTPANRIRRQRDKMIRSPSSRPKGLFTAKGKGSPYSIIERRVPELIPVFGSQPAGDVSHKPSGRLPLLSARSAVTLTTLKRAATSFAAW